MRLVAALVVLGAFSCGHHEPTATPIANSTPAPRDAAVDAIPSDACTAFFTMYARAKDCNRIDGHTMLDFAAVAQEVSHSGDSISAGGDHAARMLRYCADETTRLFAIASTPCGW